MKKLVTCQVIKEIKPIENADNIELALVLGWKVVVRKGEFKIGDKCVYCMIDSVMPDKPEFEFLRSKNFRVKTIRLKGQISQGICFPLEEMRNFIGGNDYEEGEDLTEALQVMDYTKVMEERNIAAGRLDIRTSFPGWCPMTDEIRIQVEPKLVEEFHGKLVYVTVKIDGQSFTALRNNDDYHVCSHRNSMKLDSVNSFTTIAKKYRLQELLMSVGNYAIQGEIAGPGIQKNRMNLKALELFVFDVFDIDKHKYLDYEELTRFCIDNQLQRVPLAMYNVVFYWTIDDLLELAKGKYDSGYSREGIVIRSTIGEYSNILGKRLSCKVVNNDYLLKDEV